MELKDKIAIYKIADGETTIDVKLENETLWLTQAQMCELYQTSRTNVVEHIKHIYEDGELEEEATCRKFRQVRQEGERKVNRDIAYYNLDMIIALGYRIRSITATRFRQWSNRILKDYLVKGYAINNRIASQKYEELCQLVQVLGRTISSQEQLSSEDSRQLMSLVTDYTYALDTLDKYDYQQLEVEHTTQEEKFHATYDNAMEAINQLKEKFGESKWFGNEKDESFKSSIGQIYQTFDGIELYPSVEEKAAMLLYLVTKNHSFSDGNKRIAATLFLWFMQNNGILYNTSGRKRISDGTLVALTLLIAESHTAEKDVIVKVIVNLINKNNI